MFRLLRYFSLTSLAAFILVTAILAQFYRSNAEDDLIALGESRNVALTQALSNSLWPQFGPFVESVDGLSAEQVRARPEIPVLLQAVGAQVAGTDVVKVKVYDLNGITVFSTEQQQIGEDKTTNAGFQTARQGSVVSELTHRDQFSAFEGVIEDRDLLSSYIPAHRGGPAGPIEGGFELYTDITPLLQHIQQTQRNVIIVVVVMLAALYGVLFLIVRRGEQTIRQQYADIQNAEHAAQRSRQAAEDANQAKNEFISFVTHELRLPLTSIKGYSDLIRSGAAGPVSDMQTAFLTTVRSNVDRMNELISDLSDIARIESGNLRLEMGAVKLGGVLEEIDASLRANLAAKDQTLELPPTQALPVVWGDRSRLLQIIANLVSNAHKYTPEGGKIVITSSQEGQAVHLTVQDNGLGIRPEEQAKIFQKFFRADDDEARKNSGTGLGLNLTRSLVELQGGKIWFESEWRKGTTFHLVLKTGA